MDVQVLPIVVFLSLIFLKWDEPMPYESGTIWIMFNGEIYNFGELRSDLERDGVLPIADRYRSAALPIQKYRKEMVQFLRGMFAFA
jgi:asparagine synthase (glutamine-hydrolysing)